MLNPLQYKKIMPREFDGLVFGQQHYGSKSFFVERFGQYHTVPLRDFPHSQLLSQFEEDRYGDSPYMQYLKASWNYLRPPELNTEELRRARIDQFFDLYYDVQKKGKFAVAVRVCKRPDGQYLLIDGNHRAAVALKLGIPLTGQLIPPAQHLLKLALAPGGLYGMREVSIPEQSFFYGSHELVHGRRSDILERMKKVGRADLVGQTILETGSALGANCYCAVGCGARSAVGVEDNIKMASAAIRMNAYFAAPCDFVVRDFNSASWEVEPADTVFCFSMAERFSQYEQLASHLRSLARKVLYFEGKPGGRREDYAPILDNRCFSAVEYLGTNQPRNEDSALARPFFRCEV